MSDDYSGYGVVKNNWPNAENGVRLWYVELREEPEEALFAQTEECAANGEDGFGVELSLHSERVLCVRNVLRDFEWHDRYYYLTAEMFTCIERCLGEIVRIQGQPRSAWRPFR